MPEIVLHAVPRDDLIEHDFSGEPCICGATLEVFISPQGRVSKLVTHHALDGRDLLERGEDIPLEAI